MSGATLPPSGMTSLDPAEAGAARAAADAMLGALLAQRPLLAFDFDGTLSPLVPHPDDARPDPRMLPLLTRLARHWPVAIVSGRGVQDLTRRLPMGVFDLVGNHGNEVQWLRDEAGGAQIAASAAGAPQVCAGWIDALRVRSATWPPGVELETKSMSLSLHYRHAADPASAMLRLRDEAARLLPLPEVIDGKFVLNLMPPGLVTKFEGIEQLVRAHEAGTALFVGDDVTDELAFARAPAHWLTVRVFDGDAQQPSASAARACVRGLDGVAHLLERLVALGPPAA